MKIFRPLLAAIAASLVYRLILSSKLGFIIFFGIDFDRAPFFPSVLHIITSLFFALLCLFLSMFILKEKSRENISLIVVGLWSQLLLVSSFFSGLPLVDLIAGILLYVISISLILPNFDNYVKQLSLLFNKLVSQKVE